MTPDSEDDDIMWLLRFLVWRTAGAGESEAAGPARRGMPRVNIWHTIGIARMLARYTRYHDER